MIRKDDVYRIGKIGKPHGINGEMVLFFTDDVFDRVEADYLVLELDGILVPFFIDEYRFRSEETALIKFSGIDTQEKARQITGTEVFFPRNLSDSDGDDLSMAEIIGFTITDKSSGMVIGAIDNVDNSTMNTLFSVIRDDGEEVLIPVSEEWIVDIDNKKRNITMALPEGLLSL